MYSFCEMIKLFENIVFFILLVCELQSQNIALCVVEIMHVLIFTHFIHNCGIFR